MGRKSIMAIGIVAIFLMSSFAAIGARTVSMGQNKSSTPVPRTVYGAAVSFYCINGGEVHTYVSLATFRNRGEYLVVLRGRSVMMFVVEGVLDNRSSHPGYQVTMKVIANGEQIWGSTIRVPPDQERLLPPVYRDVLLTKAPSKRGEVKTVDIFAEMKIVYDDGRTITKTASETLKIKSI